MLFLYSHDMNIIYGHLRVIYGNSRFIFFDTNYHE